MNNREIAKLLRWVAAAYLLKDENRFKVTAYEKAADTIQKSTIEVKDLWEDDKLNTLPGIGASIASHLDELFKKGHVQHFQKIFADLPKALFPLLEIPGFGPKKAYKLVTNLKLGNPDTVVKDLFNAAKTGRIASIESFGEKSQQDIIEALEQFMRGQIKSDRMLLPYAYAIASDIIKYLLQHPDTIRAIPLGGLRRMTATIGDIDIAVATKNPKEIVEWFIKYPKEHKIIEQGPTGATILLESGGQIDLRVQNPEQFGSMLQYFTGSKLHNIHLREYAIKQGLSLSEHGIKIVKAESVKRKDQNFNKQLQMYEFDSEEKFYNAIGLPWIPPEIREDRGEIETAINNKLPKLIDYDEIKGDLHIHSDYDLEPSHDLGRSSIEEILSEARRLKYEYIGISDHNPSISNHNNYHIIAILKRRKAFFEQILLKTKSTRVNLFIMLEVDMLPDGKLALPEEAFDYLDAAIISIHSSFRMDKKKMTERIIKGLSHPKAKIFAHPTGRLIGRRESYEVDWDRLFEYCYRFDKALEINAYPDRLDLPDALVKEAISKGVKFVIDTDSHEVSQMKLMHYGISVARRGWAERNSILNTLSYDKIKYWLKEDRR